MPSNASFDPTKTRTNPDRLTEWCASPVGEDILETPGVGPANKAILEAQGITTTFQLLALFLSLKGKEVGSVELCERFYQQLATWGIVAGRGEITQAIAVKLNNSFPGLYKASLYT